LRFLLLSLSNPLARSLSPDLSTRTYRSYDKTERARTNGSQRDVRTYTRARAAAAARAIVFAHAQSFRTTYYTTLLLLSFIANLPFRFVRPDRRRRRRGRRQLFLARTRRQYGRNDTHVKLCVRRVPRNKQKTSNTYPPAVV